MIKYFLLLITIIIPGFAQQISKGDLNEQVLGYFLYGNNTYLVTPKGYIALNPSDVNKQYEDYYRQVYKDSTIINPNFVVEPQGSENGMHFIMPFLDLSKYADSYLPGADTLRVMDVLNYNSNGQLIIEDNWQSKLEQGYIKSNLAVDKVK